MAVRTGIVDHDNISRRQLRQCAINGKLVVILTERPRHVVNLCVLTALFSNHGDMMIGTVQRRTHQVGHAGIQPRKSLVGLLDMKYTRHQVPIGSRHHATAFHIKLQRSKTLGCYPLRISLANAITDHLQGNGFVFRSIGYPNAAANVGKLKSDAQF